MSRKRKKAGITSRLPGAAARGASQLQTESHLSSSAFRKGQTPPPHPRTRTPLSPIPNTPSCLIQQDRKGSRSPSMPPRRAIEVRLGVAVADGGSGGGAAPRWRMPLLENNFNAFLQSSDGAAARAVFGEGSLFSPLLFGKFFDPADAFPVWEFESDVLLAALRRGTARTTVDWAETDSEYYLRADTPGGRKCDVEVSGDATMRVLDITGLWRPPPPDGRDWRAGRWWEHGFVRRVELPEDADWRKMEAYFDDGEGSLEIKVPKIAGDAHQAAAATA
uniref:SHSP domain-containing protein n=1 Tax=Leersia perrieri TaxID=77586 RepID=A0A0D9WIA6_9ORYZ